MQLAPETVVIVLLAFALGAASTASVRAMSRGKESTATSPRTQWTGPGSTAGGSMVAAQRVHGRGPAPAESTVAVKTRIIVGAPFQVDDFVGAMIREGWSGRFSHDAWLAAYRDWADRASIVVVADKDFLKHFSRHAQVTKSRERVKDRTGKVVRLETGTPMRREYYTLHEEPQAQESTASTVPAQRVHRVQKDESGVKRRMAA